MDVLSDTQQLLMLMLGPLQDLDFLFTGFTGDCKWLSPGHLQYNVRDVKIEFRQPKVGGDVRGRAVM